MSEDAGDEVQEKKGWFSRLKSGLARSTSKITEGITGIFTKRRLDDAALEELEEVLITADLGPTVAARLTAELGRTRFGKEVEETEIRTVFADQISEILGPVAQPLEVIANRRPMVVLVVGVNGTGKTTTIGKLAKQWRDQGLSVTIAAGDTFRAAAVEQLKIWGQRADVPVIAGKQGGDPSGLAYSALEQAKANGSDILLVDTAGRLQNKEGLMAELQKIDRVLKKLDDQAPDATLLVLDATTGQNAHSQVEIFKQMVDVSGLIVTKLDGSARGGVLVALAERFGLPVHAVGVGEGIEDLQPFDAKTFARSLMGVSE
ncbi:MAG: signal recognition particle-docking protein FtsY [Pseudomonadota bacterium]